MRTLLLSFYVAIAAETLMFAADDSGPRLLDNQTFARQAAATATTAATTKASIRVDVNMALVPVTVMDAMGRNVLGLHRENFRVFDGTEQRPIVSFGRTDAPVSVGVIFDCSRSMTQKFPIARKAPRELFQQLNPEDEAFLVTVSDNAEMRTNYTSEFTNIENALLFTHPTGTTSLVDGIYMGLEWLRKAHNPRKALIVVSDGGDNNSRYTLHELAAAAAEADTQIFSICLYQNPQSVEEANGPDLLGKLSQVSGGIRFMISDPNEMQDAFGKIGVTLHNQYLLGIYPPENAPSGKYRKIKVQLLVPEGLPRLQIFARSGYFVPER